MNFLLPVSPDFSMAGLELAIHAWATESLFD